MQIAFVLIHAESGSEGKVLQSLKEIEGVKEAYSAYGVFNVIAEIEANSVDELEDIVDFKTRRLNKVRTLWALVVIR